MFHRPKHLSALILSGLALLAALPAGARVTSHSSVKVVKITPSEPGVDKTVMVADAQNNASVTLEPGDTLVVRLNSNQTTGFNWNPVIDPGFPLQLESHRYISAPQPQGGAPIAGRGGIEEFRFGTPQNYTLGSSSIGLWQRFLYLRPFEPGIKDAQLWQIHVTLQARRPR